VNLSNPTGNVLTGIRFHVTTLCTSQSSNLTDMFLQCANVSQSCSFRCCITVFSRCQLQNTA